MNIIQLLRDILGYYIDKYQLPPIVLKFGECGEVREQLIVIRAFWHRAEELAIAALLHEIAHLVQHYRPGKIGEHSEPSFRDIECELLAEFGLAPVRYNRQATYYAVLQTIDGKHRWHRGASHHRTDMIQGIFSIPNPVKNQTPVKELESRPQQYNILQYLEQTCNVPLGTKKLKKIHQRFHPGA